MSPRRKVEPEQLEDSPRHARVRALKSFDQFQAGQVYTIVVTEQLAHLMVNGYLEEVPL